MYSQKKDAPMYKRGTKEQEFDQVFLAQFYRGKDTARSLVIREKPSTSGQKWFIISFHGTDVKLFKALQYPLFEIHSSQYPEYC